MKKMLREILMVLAAGLAATPAAFCAGLLRPVDSASGDLQIKEHKVKVLINNGFARTEVDQVFHNPMDKDLEAVYTFPVPDKAAMSELSLWIDGKEVVGEVLPKEEARAAYEEEKSQGREAALNEKDGSKSFEVRVTPVRAKQDTRVRLVYYQPLVIDTGFGRYVYPLEEGGVDDARDTAFFLNDVVTGEATFSFDATLKTSYPLEAVLVPSHPGAAVRKLDDGTYRVSVSSPGPAGLRRDVVINYRLADNRPAGVELLPYKASASEDGTFMLVVTPGADLKPIAHGADWNFVLDVSGSMADKIAPAAEGVEKALGRMREGDRFRIVLFNERARWLIEPFTEASAANVAQAVAQVRALRADGSTNLYEGLQLGLSGLDPNRTSAVLLVTDGVANTGVTEHKKFIELLRHDDVRLFTFVMGNSANQPLLQDMADASGGFAANVSAADSIVGQVLLAKSKLTHQAMHDVKVRVDGVKASEMTPSQPLTLYRGDQLVVLGRYQGSGKGSVEFQAKVSGKPMNVTIPVTFPEVDRRAPELERLWALARIRELEQGKRLGGDSRELEAAIRGLGTRYSLVTDYTSMIVMRDEQFAKRQLERGNEARSAQERGAQAQRAAAPAPQYSAAPVQDWQAPRLGGGGCVGPLFSLFSGAAAWTSSRRRRNRGRK